MRNNSKLDNSLSLTVDIFENVQADRYCYKGYELIWSIYDVVHMYYSIPYYLNCGDLNVLRWEDDNKKFVKKYISLIKKIFQDLFLLLYSVISIAIVGLFKRGAVAIWTGDFYDLNKRGDFRVGNLYIELESNNINYIEFIRDDAEGFVHTLKNIIKRRRVAVYYNSIERIFGWKYRNDHQTVHLKHNDKLHIDILSQAISFIAKPYKIEITRKIFRFMRVKSFICWEYSSRQANLIYAAKLNNVKTIGFMHGLGMNNYMVHEYISNFKGANKIGPDVMGVWSCWWKKYFEKNSCIYGKIEVCGELRKNHIENINNNSNIKKVLWISEPLIEPSAVIEYLIYLKKNYSLAIKRRSYTHDVFYDKLVSEYPEFGDLLVVDGDIYEAISSNDIVIGSHSTAVIDAAKLKKPFLLVHTEKWGNYFDMGDDFVVYSTSQLKSKIESIKNNKLHLIKSKYFGDNNCDGVEWLIKKVV